MTAREAGKYREGKILEAVQKCKFLSRKQIEELYFGSLKYSEIACCQVLKRLVDRKQLKRKRLDEYIYYLDKWNQKVEHYLLVNWVYINLLKHRPPGIYFHLFKHEYFCEIQKDDYFLADALVILKNIRQIYPLFVEADMDTNEFKKFIQFNRWYESQKWTETWWAQAYRKGEAYRFPPVLVVCSNLRRKNELIRQREGENKYGLRFIVIAKEELNKVYDFLDLPRTCPNSSSLTLNRTSEKTFQ